MYFVVFLPDYTPKRETSWRGPPISTSLRPGNTASIEEMSQRWQAVGNTVSNLTGPRFEPRTRDERVTAQPAGPKIMHNTK